MTAFALLHPDDRTRDGLRIIEIIDQAFPVAPPMFWVECPDGVDRLTHHYAPDVHAFAVNAAQVVPPAVPGGPNVIA